MGTVSYGNRECLPTAKPCIGTHLFDPSTHSGSERVARRIFSAQPTYRKTLDWNIASSTLRRIRGSERVARRIFSAQIGTLTLQCIRGSERAAGINQAGQRRQSVDFEVFYTRTSPQAKPVKRGARRQPLATHSVLMKVKQASGDNTRQRDEIEGLLEDVER
ncbi:hypothetical protein BDZ97DRAFT_1923501 [Flammula alnicola]|nr:hypothetical protein BDZ97DRAFT_1923501 [Flammula alnicola]